MCLRTIFYTQYGEINDGISSQYINSILYGTLRHIFYLLEQVGPFYLMPESVCRCAWVENASTYLFLIGLDRSGGVFKNNLIAYSL